METVTLRVLGQQYRVACDHGQAAALQALGKRLDQRLQALAARAGGAGRETLLLMLGLELLDAVEQGDGLAGDEALAEQMTRLAQRLETLV